MHGEARDARGGAEAEAHQREQDPHGRGHGAEKGERAFHEGRHDRAGDVPRGEEAEAEPQKEAVHRGEHHDGEGVQKGQEGEVRVVEGEVGHAPEDEPDVARAARQTRPVDAEKGQRRRGERRRPGEEIRGEMAAPGHADVDFAMPRGKRRHGVRALLCIHITPLPSF